MIELENITGSYEDDWSQALKPYQRTLVDELLALGKTTEEIALIWLDKVGAENNAPFGSQSSSQNFFDAVKLEFSKLVCGDDRYEDDRKKINTLWGKHKVAIVSTIAAAIASQLGIAVAILTPVIALLLDLFGKLGRNAWCDTYFVAKE
jgi:hypothetical protein